MSQLLRSSRAALLLGALFAGVAGAQARSPEEILARFGKSVDPQGKTATAEGFSSVATMEMPATGMSATVSSAQRKPNQLAVTITIAGLGEMRQGYDGTTAWAIDPMQGPRILSEAEAKELIDGADFRAMTRDRALLTALESAGEETVDGEPTDCVKLTWKTGRVTTECFSRTSGLLLRSTTRQTSPQGEIDVVTRYRDYKSVDGVVMAHRIENSFMGALQTITITEATMGAVDATRFELPAEIQALKKP
jgi:hypothetical protein